MQQKFEVVGTETDLLHQKIAVELSFAPDEDTVTKDVIYIGEEKTGRILNFNINVTGRIIELLLLEWPKPNTVYNLFVQKGILSVSEEELDASLRRNLVFKSDITSTVDIISPSDNEVLTGLNIAWSEKINEPGKSLINSYYLEIASDNGFFNIEKSSKIVQKQNISLTNVSEGQHFLRIRAQVNEQYGLWSDATSFYFGKEPVIDPGIPTGSTGNTTDKMAPIVDIDVVHVPDQGVTPTAAVFIMDADIDASAIKDLSLYNVTSAAAVECTYTVMGKTITITPVTAFEDNTTYKVSIGALSSLSGTKLLENFEYSCMTALSPLYCTIQDVNSVVGYFEISDDQLLYYINQASKMVDWIRSQSGSSNKKLTAPYEYDVVQFTKYKAAKEALLAYVMSVGASSGSKGMLLDIQFEFSNSTGSLKDLLKELDKMIMYWQEAMRGYGPEGRQKPLFAVKASESTPTTNSVSSIKGSTDRSLPLSGGI